MTDYSLARINMVASQVRTNDVSDMRLQEAMLDIPRERFVPVSVRPIAYASEAVPLGEGRALMEPRSFAKLAHAARINADDVLLVVGAATGYAAAVLSRLASVVIALEESESLAGEASALMRTLALDNVAVVTGPLARGYPEQGPYDVIFIDGGVETVPQALLGQLKDKGRLVAIVIEGPVGRAHLYTRTGEAICPRVIFDGAAPLLPGFVRERAFEF